MKFLKKFLFTAFFCSNAFAYTENYQADNIENLLIRSLYEISAGELNDALITLDEIIKQKPNFKLAHLIRGDIYQAYAHGISDFGSSSNFSKDKIEDLKEEAKKRIESHLHNATDIIDSPRVTLPQNIDNLIYVDTNKSRLYLFEIKDRTLIKIFDEYASIGKNGSGKNFEGDKKTPLGVYTLGEKITQPLSDFYGEGAFPIDYPNVYDKLLNKTGHGIWIHGTPKDTYSRAPKSSDGCIVISNENFNTLESILKNKQTKVILSKLSYDQYFTAENNIDKHNNFMSYFGSWISNWTLKNYSEYIAFYDANAKYNSKAFEIWSSNKKKVFENTNDVQIAIDNLTIIDYPEEEEHVKYVEFTQTYNSDLLKQTSQKKQIWRKFNNEWKIISESTY
ncbi:L,D-transpeptidase family protein [Methylophilaceae bacterium]|nr:L,D-transpeptidase family protein [Methylophilaceae bacterium]